MPAGRLKYGVSRAKLCKYDINMTVCTFVTARKPYIFQVKTAPKLLCANTEFGCIIIPYNGERSGLMQEEKLKTFFVDGDLFTVTYHYDDGAELYIGQFPSFEEEPRYTPSGRPWKNAVSIGCPYAAGDYDDCGSCQYLVKADPQDIIGVCFHERLHSRASPEGSDKAENKSPSGK